MIFRHLSLLSASMLACSSLAAQTPPCISANDLTNTSSGALTAFSFAGPNVYGWQFVPTQSLVMLSAEIYTENAFLTDDGYMSLEVWDTNASSQPGQRLTGGTWESDGALGHDWHGTSFDEAVQLNSGQTYWLVWREPGFSEVPSEPGGQAAATVRLTGGAWVTQASSWAPKWRGYCNLLDATGVDSTGFGCPTSFLRTPSMFTNYTPAVGNANFQLEASGFPAGSIGLAILGQDPAWTSFTLPGTGCELHSDGLFTATVATGTGDEGANHPPSGPGFAGHCTFPFPIPNNASLAGIYLNSQFAMLDVAIGTPLPLVFSSGLGFTIQ